MADISSISTTPSIEYLVSQYMAIERQPVTTLETQKTQVNTVKSIYTDLKTKLLALRSSAADLKAVGEDSKFGEKTSTSASESVVTVSADGNSANGSHLIKVLQLAKADTLVSNQLSQTGDSILTSEGSGTKTFTVSIDGEDTEISVEINAGDDNATILASISEAINNSDAELTASVVNDSSNTSKLVLRSDSTGSSNTISITDSTGTLVQTLGLNGSVQATATTGGYIYADDELDAKFELDGISITHSSNTIDDVLTGVTFNLKAIQDPTDDPVQITISTDADTIKSNLEDFFEKYNDVINYIKLKTAVDPDVDVRGELAGDFTFLNLRMNLRTLVSSAISSVASGNPSLISEVGIEPDDDGNLSIVDADDFEDALDDDIDKVADLFDSENGIASQIYDLLTPFTSTGGIIDDNSKILDTRITNINNHIENLETRLSWKEALYRQQFTKLQEAFNALTAQQSILQVINSSFS